MQTIETIIPFTEDEPVEDMSRYLHSRALSRLTARFIHYFDVHPLGEACAELDMILPPNETKVTPDVCILFNEQLQAIDARGIFRGAPRLVAEVVSPSTYLYDTETKKQLYAQAGVGEYWLIFAEVGILHIFRLDRQGDHSFHSVKALVGSEIVTTPLLPDFRMKVSEVI